ncbi:MAG: BMP family lipoprotein [Acetivibrionales bacterium]|jgi:basic membrane protein A
MRKLRVFVTLILIAGLLFTGCGSQESPQNTNSPSSNPSGSSNPPNEKPVKIVTVGNPLGSVAFIDEIYEGLELARDELGIEFEYVEVEEIADYETQGRFLAETGEYDLIIFVNSQLADIVKTIAEDYPEQKFTLADSKLEGVANVHSVSARDPEQHFLSGVISGIVTMGKYKDAFPMSNDANVLGYVGGSESPISRSGAAGFIAGAKYVNPDVNVLYTILNSYTDPAGGKEIALTAIAKGADVVTGNCGAGIIGILEACKEQKSYYIATSIADNDVDQSLCSSVKKADKLIYNEVQSFVEGNWKAGYSTLGMKEGICDVSLENLAIEDKYPQEILDVVDEIRQMVVNGELELPYDPNEIDEWCANNKYQW